VALARAGKAAEALKDAEDICIRATHAPELQLQAARCYAVCAAAAEPKAKQELIRKALVALHQAEMAGWKDRRLIDTDPELGLVRNDLTYRTGAPNPEP
jgi:hypothetical protein